MIKQSLAGLALLTTCSIVQAVPTVHFSDFINNGDRTNFNGFENIPNDGTFFTGGAGPYVEDGVSVQQMNGDGGNEIWVTDNGGQHEGNYSWYPSGGDSGYTQITRAGGVDFENVGMLIGSGFVGVATRVFYELLDNGISVLSGNFAPTNVGGTGKDYLGFSGGGFDTIRLADCSNCDINTTSVTDGHFQALALDSIELSRQPNGTVPEPGSLALLAAGLAGIGWRRRVE
jgi:hypothetical protein